MPNVADYDTQKKWMEACVPVRIEEGDEQDQAVAVCLNIWRERNKAMAIDYNEEIAAIRGEWNRQHPGPDAMPANIDSSGWVQSVRSDAVIVEFGNKLYEIAYTKDSEGIVTFAPRAEWVEVVREFVPAKGNALKAIRKDDDTLVVANYIVLFGGRDLEGIEPGTTNISWKNGDGSRGERFAAETQLESAYTKTGRLLVDYEHGAGKIIDASDAPGPDDVLGYVDWSTAKADKRGMWVERALNRHNEYMQWLEQLIDAGIVGTSSEAISEQIKRSGDGTITQWPLRRDTLTISPMEWRNKSENIVQALKALGVPVPINTPQPEAAPKAVQTAAVAAKAKAEIELIDIGLAGG